MPTTAVTASNAREQTLEAIASALRHAADALHMLAVQGPDLRLVSSAREPETLLTLDEASELLRSSRRTVERLVAGQSCRRRAGRKVLIERAGLLALLRKG